jgi:hypothetical protein
MSHSSRQLVWLRLRPALVAVPWYWRHVLTPVATKVSCASDAVHSSSRHSFGAPTRQKCLSPEFRSVSLRYVHALRLRERFQFLRVSSLHDCATPLQCSPTSAIRASRRSQTWKYFKRADTHGDVCAEAGTCSCGLSAGDRQYRCEEPVWPSGRVRRLGKDCSTRILVCRMVCFAINSAGMQISCLRRLTCVHPDSPVLLTTIPESSAARACGRIVAPRSDQNSISRYGSWLLLICEAQAIV